MYIYVCVCVQAKQMGVPINRIVCATNLNDTVHRCISRGKLAYTENQQTVSPAMDIQFAYNLERLLYYICNTNPEVCKHYMTELEDKRTAQLDASVTRRLQETFMSCSVDDAETMAAMKHMFAQYGYIVCPHSACAIHARMNIASDLQDPCVCVLTAHPVKFEDTVKEAIGVAPPITPAVAKLKTLPNHHFEWLRKKDGAWRESWKTEIKVRCHTHAHTMPLLRGRGMYSARLCGSTPHASPRPATNVRPGYRTTRCCFVIVGRWRHALPALDLTWSAAGI